MTPDVQSARNVMYLQSLLNRWCSPFPGSVNWNCTGTQLCVTWIFVCAWPKDASNGMRHEAAMR
jgi:hypothetical protein